MSFSFVLKDTRVTSNDPNACVEKARGIAETFTQYYLEGTSPTDRVRIDIDHKGGDTVTYFVETLQS